MPPGGSASSSSPFARSIARREPIRDRCTAWTAVTTPIEGRPIRARSAISPPTYMPISRTAASCSGPSFNTVSGSPTSLFWLPSFLSVRKRVPRTVAIASLADVLAMLPVTPTTSGSKRVRQPAATAWSAASASATRTTVTSPSEARSSGGRVTTSAAAPRATASDRKRWPSVRSPGSATKSCPGWTARESTAPPRIGRSDRATNRPPASRTRSSALRAGSWRTPGCDGWASVTAQSVAQRTLTGRWVPGSPGGSRRGGSAGRGW